MPSVTDEDGNEIPSHRHTVVKLGYLWTTEPTYNEEGEVETEGVASDMYSVDVLWKASEITEVDEDGEGTVSHFMMVKQGDIVEVTETHICRLNFNNRKMQSCRKIPSSV